MNLDTAIDLGATTNERVVLRRRPVGLLAEDDVGREAGVALPDLEDGEALVEVDWIVGDAQSLPFEDDSFDRVISIFGHMFAPDHAAAGSELKRVCRPGGRIAIACWTPEGKIGQMFKRMSSLNPPPPEGFQPPVLWGNEDHVRELLGDGATISSGPGSSPEPVPKVWAARFKRLDYGQDAKAPYRDDQLGVFSPEELARLGGARRYALEPAPGELLAVVTPRERSTAAGPRHFGRRIEFILGSTEEGLRPG